MISATLVLGVKPAYSIHVTVARETSPIALTSAHTKMHRERSQVELNKQDGKMTFFVALSTTYLYFQC